MSLNGKYTWHQHLSECSKCNPKDKERAKRTSKDSKACFQKAYVVHIKEFLDKRIGRWQDEKKTFESERKELLSKFIKEKNIVLASTLQKDISAYEQHLARLDDHIKRDKATHKNFK